MAISFTVRYYYGNSIAQNKQFKSISKLCAYTAEYSPGLGRLYSFAQKRKLNKKDYIFAVARVNGIPIAVACIHKTPSGPYAQAYVRSDFRRKKVASRLVRKLLLKRKLTEDNIIYHFGESYMPEVLNTAGFHKIEDKKL